MKDDLSSGLRLDLKKQGDISIGQVRKLLRREEAIVLLDIRDRKEIEQEYIGGATFIPEEFLEELVETRLPDKSISIVVYCTDGTASPRVVKMLREKGYSRVFSMARGINGWKKEGYEVIRGFPYPQHLGIRRRNHQKEQ